MEDLVDKNRKIQIVKIKTDRPHPAPEACVGVSLQADTNAIVTGTAPPGEPYVSYPVAETIAQSTIILVTATGHASVDTLVSYP